VHLHVNDGNYIYKLTVKEAILQTGSCHKPFWHAVYACALGLVDRIQ